MDGKVMEKWELEAGIGRTDRVFKLTLLKNE
jgi:hypothetical protein